MAALNGLKAFVSRLRGWGAPGASVGRSAGWIFTDMNTCSSWGFSAAPTMPVRLRSRFCKITQLRYSPRATLRRNRLETRPKARVPMLLPDWNIQGRHFVKTKVTNPPTVRRAISLWRAYKPAATSHILSPISSRVCMSFRGHCNTPRRVWGLFGGAGLRGAGAVAGKQRPDQLLAAVNRT